MKSHRWRGSALLVPSGSQRAKSRRIFDCSADLMSLFGVKWSGTSTTFLRSNTFSTPALRNSLIALWLALSLYTGAFIAEIVRAGILAVPKGQIEAGRSLGLRESVIMRKVILPQALRVIIPPLTSQYLNLTKNSSLAVAVGYPDLVSVSNTTLNQTGQAPEAILIMMAVYLTTSIVTSVLMNWYNSRIQLVER